MKKTALMSAILALAWSCSGGEENPANSASNGTNNTATNNTATNNTATNNNTTPPAGDGAIGAWTGDGPCIGGGGGEFVGTYRVTIDGAAVGPFSVWGVGAEATNYSLIGCHGVGGCGQGQCWPEQGVNLAFRNLGITDGVYTGERVIGLVPEQTLTVVFGDTVSDPQVTNSRSESGSATVTAWDFATQQFTGTVDVVMDSGHAITVDFDVDGPDL